MSITLETVRHHASSNRLKYNYGKNIIELESILKGKQRLEDFVNKLDKEMKQYSNNRQYERAKEIHETLQRLSSLQIKQNMETPRVGSDEEYFGIKIKDQTAHLMSFRLSNGVIKDRNKFSFDHGWRQFIF